MNFKPIFYISMMFLTPILQGDALSPFLTNLFLDESFFQRPVLEDHKIELTLPAMGCSFSNCKDLGKLYGQNFADLKIPQARKQYQPSPMERNLGWDLRTRYFELSSGYLESDWFPTLNDQTYWQRQRHGNVRTQFNFLFSENIHLNTGAKISMKQEGVVLIQDETSLPKNSLNTRFSNSLWSTIRLQKIFTSKKFLFDVNADFTDFSPSLWLGSSLFHYQFNQNLQLRFGSYVNLKLKSSLDISRGFLEGSIRFKPHPFFKTALFAHMSETSKLWGASLSLGSLSVDWLEKLSFSENFETQPRFHKKTLQLKWVSIL